jgi:four helix bundle protein
VRKLPAVEAVSCQPSAVRQSVTCLEFGPKGEAEMRDFRDLKVWVKSHQLTLAVYKATRRFPNDELFGLTSQTRRSCVSIAANIAEGCGRNSEAELARFLEIAMGSASELEYHLLLSFDLGLLSQSDCKQLSSDVVEVKQMLTSFIKKLRADG